MLDHTYLWRNNFKLPPYLRAHLMQRPAVSTCLFFRAQVVFGCFLRQILKLLFALALYFAALVGDLFNRWIRQGWPGFCLRFVKELGLFGDNFTGTPEALLLA